MANTLAKTEHIHEKVLVSALLFESVGKSSAAIDSFSSWLLAAFAGAITFLVGNLDSFSDHLPPTALRCCISLFLVVALLGIVEKMLATVIAGASAGAAVGRQMGAQLAERGIVPDFSAPDRSAWWTAADQSRPRTPCVPRRPRNSSMPLVRRSSWSGQSPLKRLRISGG